MTGNDLLGVSVLGVAAIASLALGVGSAFLLYRASGRRWTWLLTPLFAGLWLFVGVAAFGLLGRLTTKVAVARPRLPPARHVAAADPELVVPAAPEMDGFHE